MKLLLIALLTIILVSSTLISHDLFAKSKDKKARDAIVKAIGKAVEGRYSTIKIVQISKTGVSGYTMAYNNTKAVTPPSPPPNPPPIPTPMGNVSKVCLIGDLKGSTVPNMMKDCNYKIGLGDLGYAADLSYFKSLHFNKCVIGNHDATEDGSSSIYKEALAYCGDHWSLKIGTATLILGFNTNGDASAQVDFIHSVLSQNTQLKTVILVSHKGGHVPPNSHHPAEASTLYKSLENSIPSGIKIFEVFGHNHLSSASDSMNWYQAGSGGKSFYSCGTSTVWNFCDNTHLAYLELTIDNSNGNTVAHFISDGKILH
jgi:hypothetical protein